MDWEYDDSTFHVLEPDVREYEKINPKFYKPGHLEGTIQRLYWDKKFGAAYFYAEYVGNAFKGQKKVDMFVKRQRDHAIRLGEWAKIVLFGQLKGELKFAGLNPEIINKKNQKMLFDEFLPSEYKVYVALCDLFGVKNGF